MIIQADACYLPLPDGVIDLIVTDPPYGIGYISNSQGIDRRMSLGTGNKNKNIKVRQAYFPTIANDTSVPVDWLAEAYRVLHIGTALYVYTRWDVQHILIKAAQRMGFLLKNVIILAKSNHGMGDLKGAYAPSYESLIFFTKGRHYLHKRLKDVWNVPVRFSGARRNHPCEKPTSWMIPAIENSSEPGELVLDPFCGSGSTVVAAQSLGRYAIGCDIDPQWLDTAKQRQV